MKNLLLSIVIILTTLAAKGQCTVGAITGLNKVTIGTAISLTDTSVGGTWSSSDTNVALINSSTGVLKGKSRGTITITYATSPTCRAIRSISVITSFKGRTKICLSDTATMRDTLATGVWSSSRPSKVSINSLTGFMTGLDTGYSVISYAYTLSSVPYVASDTVKVANITSVGHLTSTDTIICGNTSIELNDTTTPVIWLSRDTMVAKILNPYTDSTLVYGVGQGVTKIIFASQYCNLICDSVRVHMDTLPYAGTITGGGVTVCAGATINLLSTGAMGFTPTWTCGDLWSATVTGSGPGGNTGVVNTYMTGYGTYIPIYHTVYSLLRCASAVQAYVVTAAQPHLFAMTGPASIMLGTTQPYSQSYYWNGSPTTESWTISNTSIASVGPSVQVSGLAVGSATLNHNAYNSCGGSYDSRVITVTPPEIGAISTGFSAFVNRACAAPQFGVSVPAHGTTFKLVTNYGDNHIDTTTIPSSGVDALTTFTHGYNTSGMYSIRQVLYNGAIAIDSVNYSYQHFLCHDIAVSLYIDNNDNCTFDTASEHLNYLPLRVAIDSNGVPKDTISATSGIYYSTWGSTGAVYSFRVFGVDSPLHFSCPASGIVFDTLLSSGTGTKNKNIALSCSSLPGFDLSQQTFIVAGRHKAYGSIAIANNRCTPQNAIVTLDISPKYILNPVAYWTSPTPTSVVGNRVTWNFTGVDASNIPPFIVYNLEVATPTWLIPGDTVHNTISVFPNTGDADTTNNIRIRIDTVKSSFDPNHVEVSPQGNVLNGTKLHFTIEFENDGNDTAQNIYVMDTLSDALNLSSLRMVGASAAMKIAILHSGGHNIIKFDFPGIKLPDSTHHGHCTGQVMYTINTKTGLSDGTDLLTHAGIFFDDNPVVLTDTAFNKILVPNVVIASSISDTICNGNSAHFNAIPHSVNTPHFQWYVNAVSMGTDSTGFTLPVGMGGDTVICIMTSIMDDSIHTTSNRIVLVNRGLPNPGIISGPVSVCPANSIAVFETVFPGTWGITNSHATMSSGTITGVTAGPDTVLYSVTNACGTSIATFPITINPLPFAGTITGPVSVCLGASVTLSNPATGGIWTLTNTHASHSSASITGVTVGVDTAVYTVTNMCGAAIARRALTILPLVTPSITTAVHPSDTVCAGDSVTFTSTVVNGGATPVYQWKRFTAIVASGSSYSYVPALGDVISCTLISSEQCPAPDTVASTNTAMLVIPTVTPTDVISTSIGDSVSYSGQIVSINSTISYCVSGTYQWYKNGIIILGATNTFYSAAVFTNDTFYCVNHCNSPCATTNIDTSNTLIIYADYLTTGIHATQSSTGNLSLYPNPNNGCFVLSGMISSSDNEAVHVDVMDMTGKVLYSSASIPVNGVIHHQMEMSSVSVASGHYILRLRSSVAVEYVQFVINK
ncbi:hypothetical protein CJD36_002250 [Flavipsychrobacter stenotrophus]|uniref:DUF7619 domain-containing protein n=1 Tax=Flavipsychrobacter stenotrophus TaxID=2077091 RepID=A0A2S7T069_9BACT|nr:T9SS type A sorting domain-containing protein [Flavipsychrobacter stenotrophus]PQJ12589.1 hypothetical protein CJD36_002250 [Flavipsychrobacter stenotrophus]